jgi:hypothetical protein
MCLNMSVLNLAVQKSALFKSGNSRLETISAFVTHTNEFFSGKRKALKIELNSSPSR